MFKGTVDEGALKIRKGLLPETDYRVRARLVVKGRKTVWTSWVNVTTSNTRLVDGDIANSVRAASDARATTIAASKVAPALAAANQAAAAAANALTTANSISNDVAQDTAQAIADAETARDAAIASSTSASNSASLSQRLASQGVNVLADQYFVNFVSDWSLTGTAPTVTANDHYPVGSTLKFNVAQDVASFITMDSTAVRWPGEMNADVYRVTVDLELVSGGLAGAGVLLHWVATDTTTHYIPLPFSEKSIYVGQRRTVSFIAKRPVSMFGKTFANHRLQVIANWAGFAGEGMDAKNIKVHRISVQPVTDEELGLGEVDAAIFNKSYTLAETDLAIAGQIAAFNAALIDPTGEIGQINANLAQNYYTSAETDGAVSALQTTLEANYDASGFSRRITYPTGTTGDFIVSGLGSAVSSSTSHGEYLGERYLLCTIGSDYDLHFRYDVATSLRNRTIRATAKIWTNSANVYFRLRARRQVNYQNTALEDYLSSAAQYVSAGFTTVEVEVTIPDDDHPVSFLEFLVNGADGDQVNIMPVTFEDVTANSQLSAHLETTYITTADANTAIAGAISTFNAAGPNGDLTATAGQAFNATVDLAGYATATAQLTATTVTEGGVTRISGFRATTYDGNGGAAHGALMELLGHVVAPGGITTTELGVGIGGNEILNSSLSMGILGWGKTGTGAVRTDTSVAIRTGTSYTGPNYDTIDMRQATTATSGYAEALTLGVHPNGTTDYLPTPVEPGEWWEFSIQAAILNTYGALRLVWRNSSGGYISDDLIYLPNGAGGSSTNPKQWPRYHVKGQVPAGAAFAQCIVRKYGTNSGATYSNIIFFRPMLLQVEEHTPGPSPYRGDGGTLINKHGIATGAVTAEHLAVEELIADSAQIGDLVVGNNHIGDETVNVTEYCGAIRLL